VVHAPYGPDCDGDLGYCDTPNRAISWTWHARQSTVRQKILHEIAHALTPEDIDHAGEGT